MVQKMCWLYLTHLYVAAQRHRCGDHGEVNTLDLADCWTVIGLNEGWSNWAQLDYIKISINYMTVTRIHLSKTAFLFKFLTLYEPMALICFTMAIWTWPHGTPTSLGIKRVKYIIVYHSICIFDLLSCTSSFFHHVLSWTELVKGTNLTCTRSQIGEVLPDDLAVGVCCVSWSATRDDAQSQKESAGPDQSPHSHDEVCFSCSRVLTALCGGFCRLGLYSALCEKELLDDHWLVMWTRGKVISVTLCMNCMASFTPAKLSWTAWFQHGSLGI